MSEDQVSSGLMRSSTFLGADECRATQMDAVPRRRVDIFVHHLVLVQCHRMEAER